MDMAENAPKAPMAASGKETPASREHFASRLGFILISAGCAIGLGNVWRFPYITGEYGGAAFVLLYLVFLGDLGHARHGHGVRRGAREPAALGRAGLRQAAA